MDPSTWTDQLEKMANFASVVQPLLIPLGMAYFKDLLDAAMSAVWARFRHRAPGPGAVQKAVKGGTLGAALVALGLGLLGLAVIAFGMWLAYTAWRVWRDQRASAPEEAPPEPPTEPKALPDPAARIDVEPPPQKQPEAVPPDDPQATA